MREVVVAEMLFIIALSSSRRWGGNPAGVSRGAEVAGEVLKEDER